MKGWRTEKHAKYGCCVRDPYYSKKLWNRSQRSADRVLVFAHRVQLRGILLVALAALVDERPPQDRRGPEALKTQRDPDT